MTGCMCSPLSGDDVSLASELNNFNARFEVTCSQQAKTTGAEVNVSCTFHTNHPLWAWRQRAFKHVKTKNIAGPDGSHGRVLKLCANQLVFTIIFNLSWLSVISTWYKTVTIIPVNKTSLPEWLLLSGTHLCSDYSLPATRPINESRHSTHLPHHPISSGQVREIVFHWLNFSIYHHSSLQVLHKAHGTGIILCTVDVDPGLPDGWTVGGHTSSTRILNPGEPQGSIWGNSMYRLKYFPLMYHQECPDKEHRCLVRKQNRTGPQGPAKGGLFGWTYNWWCSTLPIAIYYPFTTANYVNIYFIN